MNRKWIRIGPMDKPQVGSTLFSSFAPEAGEGKLYFVVERNHDGFTIEAQRDGKDAGPVVSQRLFIPYVLLPVTNFFVWSNP